MSRAPDHTVLREGRLVAHVFAGGPGALVVAGKAGRELERLSYAGMLLFDKGAAEPLLAIVRAADSLDALLFKLGLEGYEVRRGAVVPDPTLRKF